MRPVQPTLFDLGPKRLVYGGSTKGRRKVRRPLSFKHPVHLVLRSEKAVNELSFRAPKHRERVRLTIERQARKHFVRVQSQVNSGNHLHLMVRAKNRAGFQAFLRSVTAMIARLVTGARRGHPFGKFWDGLAYTRALTTTREERILKDYLTANHLEAEQGRIIRELFLVSRSREPWRQSRRTRGT